MKDTKEEIRRADMFKAFKPAMDQLRDADSALYAEPMSIAQMYDLIYASTHNIERPPERSSHRTPDKTMELYTQER